MEQQDGVHTGLVHDTPMQSRVSQLEVTSHLVNGHNIRLIVWPVVLLVLTVVLHYIFVVDDEIVVQ